MKILLADPFFTGSHRQWALDYQRFSSHEVDIASLSGHYWKWRMYGGAVTLARRVMASNYQPDLILATDMLDLSTFLALTKRRLSHVPAALYFHENQLTYPWSDRDPDLVHQRDRQYAFINFTSALAADAIFFNSNYHQSSFFEALPVFLRKFPDHNELNAVKKISGKSQVLHLALDLQKLDSLRPKELKKPREAVILWNHRWEHDKNPAVFFRTLLDLSKRSVPFKLVVLGRRFSESPPIFAQAKERLQHHILHWGFAEVKDYAYWLWMADILPVTSKQDFFGASVVQAMYCNTLPLLPQRLAYPEHLPKEVHDRYIYQGDFDSRLEDMILNIKALRNGSVRACVERYSWQNSVEKYDQILSKIVTPSSRSNSDLPSGR